MVEIKVKYLIFICNMFYMYLLVYMLFFKRNFNLEIFYFLIMIIKIRGYIKNDFMVGFCVCKLLYIG